MVGDVKQSIYRFRLAKPDLFIEKYNSYSTQGEGKEQRIDLYKTLEVERIFSMGLTLYLSRL